jgi:hypothetical protein
MGGGSRGWVDLIDCAFNLGIKPINLTCSHERDEVDGFGVARFKADGGACGDVEALTPGGGPIELQGGVDFKEMEVGTDLDRPIAGIGDAQGGDGSARIEVDGAGLGKEFAGNHGVGAVRCAARQFMPILPQFPIQTP